ncbi:MAG: hypothetical protein ACK4M7_11200, partial [Burkholderiales bacterium]
MAKQNYYVRGNATNTNFDRGEYYSLKDKALSSTELEAQLKLMDPEYAADNYKYLEIKHISLKEDCEPEAVIDFIKKIISYYQWKEITLTHIDLQADLMQAITKELKIQGELQRLNLSYNNLQGSRSHQLIDCLVRMVSSNPTLRALLLNACALEDDVIEKLMHFLRIHPNIKHIELKGNHFSNEGRRVLDRFFHAEMPDLSYELDLVEEISASDELPMPEWLFDAFSNEKLFVRAQ